MKFGLLPFLDTFLLQNEKKNGGQDHCARNTKKAVQL